MMAYGDGTGRAGVATYEVQGWCVRSRMPWALGAGEQLLTLDASDLTPVLYVYEIRTSGERITRPLLVRR